MMPIVAPLIEQPDVLPDAQTIDVEVTGDAGAATSDAAGNIQIPTADGGVVIEFGGSNRNAARDNKFDDNLSIHMGEGELSLVAENLLQGIGADEQSRAEWMATRERAIDLLGIKLEEPRGDIGSSSAPLEGMATVRHPVLLEATLRAQATACGELLPAAGPAKVENVGQETEQTEELAEALEKDFNDYLTNRAKEYYPDTRRALFWSSLSGASFKKVYNCPLRLRPVSETVDAKDLIVSSGATDLANANRVTHQISMRQSVLKRMQVANVYRDVPLSMPTSQPNQLDQKEAQTEGIALRIDRPEDQPYTVYECYCELDLDEYAPKQFKDKAIPLPYRVTIEKDSRAVLEIRRNWNEDDEQCLARRAFVKYPYVEGMGIYGIGLLHILGNPTSALTAAWRLMLDNGMFANFPGGIVDKAASRQLQNGFRVAPGQCVQLDFGGRNANQVIGQLPYRDLGPVWVQFITHMEEVVQRLGGAAETNVGEGKQDAPVGTTLALIEQATKIESEVHKGLHSAQAEEFQLLKQRFIEDPGALWRHVKKSESLKLLMGQTGQQAIAQEEDAADEKRHNMFIAALNDVELVPQADPNSPSHTHRILKFQGLKQLAGGNSNIDQDEVDKIGVRILGFDPAQVFRPPSAEPPPPDPKLLMAQAAQAKAQSSLLDSQTKSKTAEIDAQIEGLKLTSQQRIAELQLQREVVIHAHDTQLGQQKLQADTVNRHLDRQAELQKHQMGLGAEAQMHSGGLVADLHKHRADAVIDHLNQHLDRQAEARQHQSGVVGEHLDRVLDLHKHDTQIGHEREQAEMERRAAQSNGDKSE